MNNFFNQFIHGPQHHNLIRVAAAAGEKEKGWEERKKERIFWSVWEEKKISLCCCCCCCCSYRLYGICHVSPSATSSFRDYQTTVICLCFLIQVLLLLLLPSFFLFHEFHTTMSFAQMQSPHRHRHRHRATQQLCLTAQDNVKYHQTYCWIKTKQMSSLQGATH